MREPWKDARVLRVNSTDSDEDLMRCISLGDQRALALLYYRHNPLMYSVALRILRTPSDVEDTIQDAWVQIWQRASTYNSSRGCVAAWALTIARNRAIDRLRSLNARQNAETQSRISGHAEPPTLLDGAAAASIHGELHERVCTALAALTAHQRQALELAYFGGLSQSDIAQALEVPLGTVKSWTRQALSQLGGLFTREEWV